MKSFQVILLTLCVVGALARPEGDAPDHAKWHEKHKKHIECAYETKNLTQCCPMPQSEELKNDPECKVHIEGLEDKDDKQKGKAAICFIECIFKSKGLIEGKEVKWDKIRELNEQLLGEEFKDVGAKAVDFCEAKVNAVINATLELLKRPLMIIQPIIVYVPVNVTQSFHINEAGKNVTVIHVHHPDHIPVVNHTHFPLYHVDNQGKEAAERFKNHKGGPPKHHHQPKEAEKRCGMIPTMISSCIQGYIVRSCPESKWTGTDECEALKSKAKTIEECTSH